MRGPGPPGPETASAKTLGFIDLIKGIYGLGFRGAALASVPV